MRIFALVVVAALAGCSTVPPAETGTSASATQAVPPSSTTSTGSQTQTGSPSVAPAPLTPHFPELFDCTSYNVLFAGDSAKMADSLPAGYTLSDAGPVVLLGLEAFSCATGVGADGTPLTTPSFAVVFASVDPPSGQKSNETTNSWAFEVVATPNLMDSFARAGITAQPGEVEVAASDEGVDGSVVGPGLNYASSCVGDGVASTDPKSPARRMHVALGSPTWYDLDGTIYGAGLLAGTSAAEGGALATYSFTAQGTTATACSMARGDYELRFNLPGPGESETT